MESLRRRIRKVLREDRRADQARWGTLFQQLVDDNGDDELDPVGSTVRYEMMKLCTGSEKDTMRRWQLVIDDTLSVEGINALMP